MAGLSRGWNGGHRAWLSYSGAFKAPELDQLYDQRPFDLGFGTFHISSHSLAPQRGEHWDAGGHVILGGRVWLDAAVYHARSRNEIGFDLARFRLDNIDRSRHAGVEAELGTAPWHGVSGAVSACWTRATFEGGFDLPASSPRAGDAGRSGEYDGDGR